MGSSCGQKYRLFWFVQFFISRFPETLIYWLKLLSGKTVHPLLLVSFIRCPVANICGFLVQETAAYQISTINSCTTRYSWISHSVLLKLFSLCLMVDFTFPKIWSIVIKDWVTYGLHFLRIPRLARTVKAESLDSRLYCETWKWQIVS